MKPLALSRYALSIGALALLAACALRQDDTQPPIVTPGVTPESLGGTTHEPGGSWALPEAAKSDLLYVGGVKHLFMFTYPDGKLVGVIHNPHFAEPAGECVDAAGDVFVTNLASNQIFEYKHGRKRLLKTLDAPAGDELLDCAVDPTTGNLAVTVLEGSGHTSGGVVIFADARGSPETYTAPHIHGYYFCGYDDRGNLFVDGVMLGTFHLAELRAGRSKFVDISLNQKIEEPGSVLWDGKYLAVGDQRVPDVYEFSIDKFAGTLVNTTPINGVNDDRAFWIQGKRILVVNRARRWGVDFFDYPGGGNATKLIFENLTRPNGLTISIAPH